MVNYPTRCGQKAQPIEVCTVQHFQGFKQRMPKLSATSVEKITDIQNISGVF